MTKAVFMALAALLLATSRAPAQSPCPVTIGFSGSWTPPSYVQQFWWDRQTSVMEVNLSNGEIHGFVNIPSAMAQQFSQMSSAQTQKFYQQKVAPGNQALLFEAIPGFFCPLQLEPMTKLNGAYLGVGPNQVMGVAKHKVAGEYGTTSVLPQPVAYLWMQPGAPTIGPYLGVGPGAVLGVGPGAAAGNG